MATFRVKAPDGRTYDVNGPPGSTAEQALKQVQRKFAKPAPSSKRSFLQTAGDFIGDTVDNVIPNWGDEIAAAGGATKALFRGGDVGATFRDSQRRFKEEQKSYDKEHPALAWGSTLTGVGLGLAAPVGKAVTVASRGRRMIQGAKVGAAYGAASGAGEGNTLAERGGNAATSAAIGATVGTGLVPLSDSAVAIGRSARQNIPGVEPAIRTMANVPRAILQKFGVGSGPIQPGQRAVEQADRMAAKAMNEGNISLGSGQPGPSASPASILAEQQRRQAMSVPAMPADITEPMRDLTSWASRGAGPGQTAVREAVRARKAGEGARARQHVTETMGPLEDPILALEKQQAATRTAAAPGYEAAYAKPMVLTPEIQEIMKTPAFADAMEPAVRNIRNAKKDPKALGFTMNPDGSVMQSSILSTEGFDQVIRAMRANGRKAAEINQITGAVKNTTDSVHINARAGDLKAELANQNGPYKEVTERYADEMAQADAMRRGGDIAKLTGPEISAQSRAMPENAQEAWATGARSALADEASAYGAKFPNGDITAQVRKGLGDDTKQAAIEQMGGNTGAVPRLQDRLEAEAQGNIVFKEVEGNSRTAGRQQIDADMDAQMGNLSNLSTPGMVRSAMNFMTRNATAQFKTDVKARIGSIVTETNPATVAELMQEIAKQAQKDRDFATLLQKSGILATKAYGMNIKPEGQ